MLHLVQTFDLLPLSIRNCKGRDSVESSARAIVQTSTGVYDSGACPYNDFFEMSPDGDVGHGHGVGGQGGCLGRRPGSKRGGGKGMAESTDVFVPAGLRGPSAVQCGAAPQQCQRNKKGGSRQPHYPLHHQSSMPQNVQPQPQAELSQPPWWSGDTPGLHALGGFIVAPPGLQVPSVPAEVQLGGLLYFDRSVGPNLPFVHGHCDGLLRFSSQIL
mmetsp:Transcript_97788/g.262757  ORF Transcript_97788/g.262757 Transcript_97788/m.262757 type:complete len:215 (+) Transcript_97788:2-646(+)